MNIEEAFKNCEFKYLELEKLKIHPKNSIFGTSINRENGKVVSSTQELGESIKRYGVHTPLVVSKDNVILSGHRRFHWAIHYKIKSLPCMILKSSLSENEEYQIILDANLHFRRFDSVQLKRFKELRDEQIEEKIGLDVNLITSKNKQNRVTAKKISEKAGVSIKDARAFVSSIRGKEKTLINKTLYKKNEVNETLVISCNSNITRFLNNYNSANEGTRKVIEKIWVKASAKFNRMIK